MTNRTVLEFIEMTRFHINFLRKKHLKKCYKQNKNIIMDNIMFVAVPNLKFTRGVSTKLSKNSTLTKCALFPVLN